MPSRQINSDKPHLWKADIAASVDLFNQWFMDFAPAAFRDTRVITTERVKAALIATNNLRDLNSGMLQNHPDTIATLRMCTAPPLAVDRLIGLASASKSLVSAMERGKLATRMKPDVLVENLDSICRVLTQMLDRDIFPWLAEKKKVKPSEVARAATIVADRLCSAVSNPIIRNAQEQRQLTLIGGYLDARGYRKQPHSADRPLKEMEAGTYSYRMIVHVGKQAQINLPVDVACQPKKLFKSRLPILIEAKSAGDFTNTNKRRKEEATKIRQLRDRYGSRVRFILFLCGYFGSDYLGYEAAEGIDWVWEHRVDDLKRLGL